MLLPTCRCSVYVVFTRIYPPAPTGFSGVYAVLAKLQKLDPQLYARPTSADTKIQLYISSSSNGTTP